MSEKKVVRTVSRLNELTSLRDNSDRMWFEVSKLENAVSSLYSSNKCSYDTVRDHISADSNTAIAGIYQLSAPGYVADVKGMNARVSALESSDISVVGLKTFTETPVTPLKDISALSDYSVVNAGQVRQSVEKYGGYYNSDSYTDKMPIKYAADGQSLNGSVYEWGEPGASLYYWHIDHGQTDSSKYVDTTTEEAVGPVEITKTGQLVIYGWLADSGSVLAQEAWVGLFAELNDAESGSKQFMPLQIQPWIQGTKHAVLQYVGFNVPVYRGMKLKIMTGFTVNGSNTGLSRGNCLLFKDHENMTNTFIGYVIESGD